MTTHTTNGNGHHRLADVLTPDPVPVPVKQVDVIHAGPTRPAPALIRAAAWWVARWLLSWDDRPHAGRIEVVVRTADGTHERLLRPTIAELESPAHPFGLSSPGRFFSEDEMGIVRALAAQPLPLKVLVKRARLSRSTCVVIVGGLQDRGVVRVGADGYELTSGPWAELAAE